MSTHNVCFYGENYPRIIIKYSSLTSPQFTMLLTVILIRVFIVYFAINNLQQLKQLRDIVYNTKLFYTTVF